VNDSSRAAVKLFISYSHKDERLKSDLQAHLGSLQREGRIEFWHDREIMPGSHWESVIDDHLEGADVIILLVSADFISSNYCWGVEVARALELHKKRSAIVVPVLVRPVSWEATPLRQFQALPIDGRAVSTWQNRNNAWKQVVEGMKRIVNALAHYPSPFGRHHLTSDTSNKSPIVFGHIGSAPSKVPKWHEEAMVNPASSGTCVASISAWWNL
jgi:hypothetical protein